MAFLSNLDTFFFLLCRLSQFGMRNQVLLSINATKLIIMSICETGDP